MHILVVLKKPVAPVAKRMTGLQTNDCNTTKIYTLKLLVSSSTNQVSSGHCIAMVLWGVVGSTRFLPAGIFLNSSSSRTLWRCSICRCHCRLGLDILLLEMIIVSILVHCHRSGAASMLPIFLRVVGMGLWTYIRQDPL